MTKYSLIVSCLSQTTSSNMNIESGNASLDDTTDCHDCLRTHNNRYPPSIHSRSTVSWDTDISVTTILYTYTFSKHTPYGLSSKLINAFVLPQLERLQIIQRIAFNKRGSCLRISLVLASDITRVPRDSTFLSSEVVVGIALSISRAYTTMRREHYLLYLYAIRHLRNYRDVFLIDGQT